MAVTKKINLLDLATLFAKRKKFLLKMLVGATVIGVIIALIWPKSYKSGVTFIVTEGNAINFSSGGLLNGLANLSVKGDKVTAEQALILLRSTIIQDQVIDKFDLGEVYGKKIPEYIRKELDNRIIVTEEREGGLGFNSIIAITFDYEDEDPERVFSLVSYYYSLLDSTMESLNKQGISDGYNMLKTRLEQNERELAAAEDSLVSFQKEYGLFEVEEQARAQIKNMAELKTQIVKLEIQIGYAAKTLGVDNKRIEDLKIQKQEFEQKYNQFLLGEDPELKKFDIFQSMKDLPDLGVEYLRRYREVVIQEEIYKVLFPQFEQQKLNFEEANSGLRVIDPPVLATYKSAPKRVIIVLAFFLFGGLIAVLVVLFKEWKEDAQVNNPDEYKKYEELKREIRNFK